MKPVVHALAAAALLAFVAPALAEVPYFTATCPSGPEVTSDGMGKVKIDSKKAAVQSVSGTAWKAQVGRTILDIGQDGSKIFVSDQNGVVCQVTSAGDAVIASVPHKDRQACLAAVSHKTRNPTVAVLDATAAEASNTVIVGVGTQKARWQCLVKNGHVADVMSLTNEGGL